MSQRGKTDSRSPIIGSLSLLAGQLSLLAVEHLRNVILDRDDDGTITLSAECPFCREIMEWAGHDATG